MDKPRSWKKALTAVYDSNGLMETVNDEEILEAQRLLAGLEGLFVEPASAASIAGLKKVVELGLIERSETTVCIATGHGLKDPDTVIKNCDVGITEFDPSKESLAEVLDVESVPLVRA